MKGFSEYERIQAIWKAFGNKKGFSKYEWIP